VYGVDIAALQRSHDIERAQWAQTHAALQAALHGRDVVLAQRDEALALAAQHLLQATHQASGRAARQAYWQQQHALAQQDRRDLQVKLTQQASRLEAMQTQLSTCRTEAEAARQAAAEAQQHLAAHVRQAEADTDHKAAVHDALQAAQQQLEVQQTQINEVCDDLQLARRRATSAARTLARLEPEPPSRNVSPQPVQLARLASYTSDGRLRPHDRLGRPRALHRMATAPAGRLPDARGAAQGD
jgi:chromosome segregation ATPase